MALETTTYQCPNCNGRLVFDGSLGRLKCEFCDSSFTTEEVEGIYAARQEQADKKAAGDRLKQLGVEPDMRMTSTDLAAWADALSQARAQGLDEQETQRRVQAALAASGASAETQSAAAASMSHVTHVNVGAPVEGEDPIDTYLRQSKWEDAEADNLRAFNCPACGAQLLVDQVTAVTRCPYCGNNAVVPGQLSDVLKPDFIIPFKVTREQAIAGLKEYYGGKRFLSAAFTEGNHLEEIQGIYVPFWLYTGKGEAEVTFDAQNTRAWSDSENDYVETDHYELFRSGYMNYTRVPVDGSTKMPDAHMDAIEPFDYSELVPFSVGYLPGYLTDRYDLDVSECDERARHRVENSCVDTLRETAGGYMSVTPVGSYSDVNWTNIAYALLPVWMLHTTWEDDDYLFAMNGQTGKFIGDLPIDKGKVRKRYLTIFLPLFIIILAICVVMFGLLPF